MKGEGIDVSIDRFQQFLPLEDRVTERLVETVSENSAGDDSREAELKKLTEIRIVVEFRPLR